MNNSFYLLMMALLSLLGGQIAAMGDYHPDRILIDTEKLFSEGITDMERVFDTPNAKYFISREVVTEGKIVLPERCELAFKQGGAIRAEIIFNQTELSGYVDLKGSSISGTIANDVFNAGWLCLMDGISDDAASINSMIEACRMIFFPKGIYLLQSFYNPPTNMQNRSSIRCHVGINKSHVTLLGEDAVWLVPDNRGALCVFTEPGYLDDSVGDIIIENLEFRVLNDGEHFHEWTHTLHCIGVDGLTVRNCLFNDFWGDAITLGHYGDTPETGERARNRNVFIINNIIKGGDHHNNRNGISVINGENVLILGNRILNTTKSTMPGAIDVEPNNSAYTINNIVILNNYIFGCHGTAGGICIHANKNGGPAHNITIEGNHIEACSAGLSFVVAADNTTSNYVVKNNVVEADTRPVQFVGTGKSEKWSFSGNVFKQNPSVKMGGSIKISNLNVVDVIK